MMFNVPQFIDVEDKIAGPLTWKQILWMIGMGAVLLTLYNLFDSVLFFITAIPVIILFAIFAFYRPNGVSMITFALHGLFFIFQPKISVWERPVSTGPLPRTNTDDTASSELMTPKKIFDSKQAHALAELIDGRK
jgi:ABC-type proline/glycine betaine transport system permease subunit